MSSLRPLALAGVLIVLALGYLFRSHFSHADYPISEPKQASRVAQLRGKNSMDNPAEEMSCDGIPRPCIPDPPKSPQPGAVWTPSDDGPNGITRITENASMLFYGKRFADLDGLIERYGTLRYRLDDGRFKLSVISQFFEQSLGVHAESIESELAPWVAANPKSPGAATALAVAWSNAAWRARGNGLASTVSPEGWKLFHDRMQRALTALKQSESYASTTPLWYIEYMQVNLGLNLPLSAQLAFYERATKAFPDYFPLHFQMLAPLLPQWGGSYKAMAAFIDVAAAHAPPPVRAETYTRLWWRANQMTDLDADIFRDMGASWPRMREGFESLLKTYPNSRWNRSNFASFACDAGDMTTYVRLRADLGEKIYANAFPPNASIDVCDARAAGKKT